MKIVCSAAAAAALKPKKKKLCAVENVQMKFTAIRHF